MRRYAISAGFALLATVLASTRSAHAGDSAFDTYFTKPQDGAPCYARTYDDAYLKAHPAQTVQRLEIDMQKTNASGHANAEGGFELGFGVMLKRAPEWYTGLAICKPARDGFDCFLEGDGGLFHLAPDGADSLRLKTGDYGIALEGGHDFMKLDGKTGDDRVFKLPLAVHAECDASTADLKSGEE